MSELVSALARRALRPVFEADARPDGLRSWIDNGGFYLDAVPANNTIELRVADLGDFAQYQLFDYARFALSSLETVANCRVESDHPRALSWPLLKSYYAGFFGAHAIMRALGQGVARLENRQASYIAAFGITFDTAIEVQAGNYFYQLTQKPDLTFVITLSRLPDTGGAHEAFWRRFGLFLSDISSEVGRNNEPDAALVIGKLAELQTVLTRGGAYPSSWLSVIRNKINYQHTYGGWFPYKVSQREVDFVADLGYRSVSAFRLDYDFSKEVLQAFGAASAFIASVNCDLANLLVASEGIRHSRFAENWRRLASEAEVPPQS